MRDYARILSIAAVEAVEESDTISRRPEAIKALRALAEDSHFPETIERAVPGAMTDPAQEARDLAAALEPFRHVPLEEPELIERLAFFAWALSRALTPTQAPAYRAA